MYSGYITDVKGIKVGHAHSEEGITGLTVIISEEGAIGGVDVRGSAPGTRETDLFRPDKMVEKINAIVLSGGSAFGLDASSGVMEFLEKKGIGLDVGFTKVPIVASAVIFDLNLGDHTIRPDKEMGYRACENATLNEDRQGNIGCGMGASVGKILGFESAMKSGIGSASIKVGDLIVSAIICTNSLGDIYEGTEQIAGVYDYNEKKLLNTLEIMKSGHLKKTLNHTNTTIGVVATNARLTKAYANKLAEISHNGFARAINPVHTMYDGDTIFSLATNEIDADINLVFTLGAEVVRRAIVNSIFNAESLAKLKAYKDIIN
ncbi:MAG: P1 family peptidase [Tissierellales bacterium]|nr:P1 family peptidase [Tissierellales bacterium]